MGFFSFHALEEYFVKSRDKPFYLKWFDTCKRNWIFYWRLENSTCILISSCPFVRLVNKQDWGVQRVAIPNRSEMIFLE